jgi:2-C-methyl-D-erythritol 2,4-cyclodiphosphate synthase
MTHRVGIGYDIHRLEPGSGLVIAGTPISCPYRFVAHSDGDVVLHALCDALLGAVGAGDIGEHFPDSDPEYAGCQSSEFVMAVLAIPALKPWRVVNMDCNIIAQEPRLGPYKPAMRKKLAELLFLPMGRIGVKARTNEGLDAVGMCQAIQAQVVVLLEPVR